MSTDIDLDVAQQTRAIHFPALLGEADLDNVRSCHQEQLVNGRRPQQHEHKRRTFLNGGGAARGGLQGSAPAVVAKLFRAASQAKQLGGWGEQQGGPLRDIDMRRFRIRVAELWEYQPGGGLVDDYHYDGGSIVTIVCLLNNLTDFTGGVFRTFESNGMHAEHILERGDVLCLLSHKYHNVTPVITGQRHSLVLELFQDDDDDIADDDNCARMASDQESGFVGCGGLAAAQQAVHDSVQRLEFTGIKSRSELGECLNFVEELLVGPLSTERSLQGLSFASCSLNSDDLGRLASVLQNDIGQKLTAFGVSKNPGVDCDAWHKLWAHLPEKATWLDFGDNQLVDADVAPFMDDLPSLKELGKLYLDGNQLRDLSILCKSLPDTNITELDLGDNSIDDTNVAMLSTAVANSFVTLLVMGTNPISAAGITSLIDTLPSSRIEVLYLDHTGVDDACLAALAKVLKHSKLAELHVDSTKVTDAGVRDLLPHIGASELRHVDVAGNGVSDATMQLLDNRVGQEFV
ncbi:unnamed protein product [Polarella glacialis]|uniref:Uncharacterized protein n=1 Tax=Polarella glacialis TaxID=89957 RepID=A0A813I4Y7_POLGL|nr:unnamed protein product [Polarella glacialis]